MKTNLLLAVCAFAVAACGANKDQASEVSAASSKKEVKISGPTEVNASKYSFIQNQGGAFSIEIDKGSTRGCWPSAAWQVTKLSDIDYVVEILAVKRPMIVCRPEMVKEHPTGATIEIAANGSFTYANVLVVRDFRSVRPAAVDAKLADASLDKVEINATDVKLDSYLISQDEGKGFVVEVDYKKIKGCYKTIGHKKNELLSETALVSIEGLMVPAVMCRPNMMRDIQYGVSFEVKPEAPSNFTYKTVLVAKDPISGQPAKLTAKAIR